MGSHSDMKSQKNCDFHSIVFSCSVVLYLALGKPAAAISEGILRRGDLAAMYEDPQPVKRSMW